MPLRLVYRNAKQSADAVRANWRGVSVEYVTVPGGAPYEFSHVGEQHYLALHDLKLQDGELNVDTRGVTRARDLRDTITFVPKGCGLSGWAHPAVGDHAFVALHFDPATLHEELEARYVDASPAPAIYERDRGLQSTLLKLQRVVTDAAGDALQAESLCLLAAIETIKIAGGPTSGQLSKASLNRVCEFIDANLGEQISLDELAQIAGLTRFHFARAFKATMGQPPYQYLASKRVEAAGRLLVHSDLALNLVAASVGLSPQQFRRTFIQRLGLSPQAFRTRNR